MSEATMHIGVLSLLYPMRSNQNAGVFVRDSLDRIARHARVSLLSPLPNQMWFRELGAPTPDTDYPVERPFVLAFPRYFMQQWYPKSLAHVLRRYTDTLFDGCDVIHAHRAFPEAVAAVDVFGGRIPVVVTVHGSDVNRFALKKKLAPLIIAALNRTAMIICVGTALGDTLRRIGVTSPMTLIPNGIDASLCTLRDKRDACTELGLDPARPRLLYAGNFVAIKGIEYLIRAMPKVLESYPELELVLLGADPAGGDRTRYDSEIADTGVGAHVRIVDRVPHDALSSWLQASDALVLPSLAEGFGLVCVEALACGRPVAATRSGGPEDIVGPGDGHLANPADPASLAETIVQTLNDVDIDSPDVLSRRAYERFSLGSVTERILDVYRNVTASAGG